MKTDSKVGRVTRRDRNQRDKVSPAMESGHPGKNTESLPPYVTRETIAIGHVVPQNQKLGAIRDELSE